ncbi:MAG: HAD family hydrolase [Sandaracinaceae bacterium]
MSSARPSLPPRPCPVCGRPVRPLRAGAVILLEDGFRFLCDAQCRDRFRQGERDHEANRHLPEAQTPRASTPLPPRPRRRASPSTESTAAHQALSLPRSPPPWLGLGASVLGFVLAWFAHNPYAAGLSTLGTLAAAGEALRLSWAARQETGWLAWSFPSLGVVLALLAAWTAEPDPRLLYVGGAVAGAAVVTRAWLDAHANQPLAAIVSLLVARMPGVARVPQPSEDWAVEVATDRVDVARVRAGQSVLVGAGEGVPVDGVVEAGEAWALLHPSTRTPVRRVPGDPLLAGATITEGEVRVLATRVGADRALVRPIGFGEGAGRRAARLTNLASRAARVAGPLALLAAGAAAALALGGGASGPLSAAAAVLLAAPLVALRRASESPYVAAAASAAERGITFGSARELDRAGRTAVAALCTHGTITEGEPEVVEIASVGDAEWSRVAALVAGAESAVEAHSIAGAVNRFCDNRGIEPIPVRRAQLAPGRGITAVTPEGESLVVGNRGLLISEGVSVAVADADATRSEERGHSVIFVATEGRARAVISLRDEERLGARAAVQRLIDLGIEAVLLSGDHRGTIEALAAQLDITHVKAELLPEERGKEVKRLRETGGVVAVVGRSGRDDMALEAADVAVVLGAAGAADGERAVSLTSDDVRDAAAALWLARATRQAAWRSTALALAGGGAIVGFSILGSTAPGLAALMALGVDTYVLPTAARLLRRIELRLPARG